LTGTIDLSLDPKDEFPDLFVLLYNSSDKNIGIYYIKGFKRYRVKYLMELDYFE
jgi:hypothetical protein